jgi:hypothetical protein
VFYTSLVTINHSRKYLIELRELTVANPTCREWEVTTADRQHVDRRGEFREEGLEAMWCKALAAAAKHAEVQENSAFTAEVEILAAKYRFTQKLTARA